MVETGVMLVSLKDVDEPLPEILRRVGETELDGVEFADWIWPLIEEDAPVEGVAAALSETGLDATTAMPPIGALEENLERYVEVYGAFGVETFAVGFNDVTYFESPDRVREAAARLSALVDRVDAHDMDVVYHNHTHEFTELADGRIAFDLLVEETDRIGFEIDAAWVAVGGEDVVGVIERLDGRVPIVHLKDADLEAGTDVDPGEGDLDLEAIADAAVAAGAEWLNYEYSSPADPYASLERGAERIAAYRDAVVR